MRAATPARRDWPGGEIEFHTSHGDWMRGRRAWVRRGRPHERYAPEDAPAYEYYDITTTQWGRAAAGWRTSRPRPSAIDRSRWCSWLWIGETDWISVILIKGAARSAGSDWRLTRTGKNREGGSYVRVDFDDVPNWRGRDVIDQNGYAIGVIADLYVDEVTGRPEWAAVKTGLFSHKVTFVPLSQAAPHGLRVQVPYHQSHIHDAPNIDPHGHLSADEEARLYQHYGLDYSPASPSGADSEFIVPATDKVEAEAPVGTRLRRHVVPEQDPDRTLGE